jgi:hypothetical protein
MHGLGRLGTGGGGIVRGGCGAAERISAVPAPSPTPTTRAKAATDQGFGIRSCIEVAFPDALQIGRRL